MKNSVLNPISLSKLMAWVAAFASCVVTCHAQVSISPEVADGAETVTFSLDSPSAESDAEQLMLILQETDMDRRHLLLTALGMEMGKTNPKQGWQFVLKKFSYLPDRQVFSLALLRSWGRRQPMDAVAACQDIPAGERRSLAYSGALEGWALTAPEAAAKWAVENLSSAYRRAAVGRIGRVWAREEPKKAADWATAQSHEIDRIFVLSEVLESWADVYGPDAAEWATKLPAGKFRDLMVSKAVFRWADYFPKTTAEWLMMNSEHNWLLPRVLAKWAAHDQAAATIWVGQIANEALALQCRMAIVNEWALYNPKTASEWAQANLQGENLSVALGEILINWGAEYPLEALDWLKTLEPESERTALARTVMQAWALADAERFSRWVRDQPPGFEKDAGTAQLASLQAQKDEKAGLATAMTIQTPALRQDALLEIFQDWKLRDEAAAKAWLRDNPAAEKHMSP